MRSLLETKFGDDPLQKNIPKNFAKVPVNSSWWKAFLSCIVFFILSARKLKDEAKINGWVL